MIDLKLFRDNPELIRDALKKRGVDPDELRLRFHGGSLRYPTTFEELLRREKARRAQLTNLENDRHRLKEGSDKFAQYKTSGKAIEPPAELTSLSQAITQAEQRLRVEEGELLELLANLPNIPHSSVPAGDAGHNQVVRTYGKPAAFSFLPKTHLELGALRGLLDLERAAKITGSHFPLFTGQGARLVRAMICWMLDVQTKEHGYTEIWPPALVNRASMFGTGQLPKFEEDMYRLKDDDLFLIPTAEVPVTNLHRDEILDEAQLPLKYTAYTPCFRREAGSYGKETKGLVRVHQFDKVELVKFTVPEASYEELERLVLDAEVILQRLGLHYRVVCLAAGDLGFSAAKCYDLEAWAPGLHQYLEVSSCSNFETFQARRANIRYRPACAPTAVGAGRQTATKKLAYVHTLNGSGVALARTLICLLETHQQPDGRIRMPEPLRPYFDGQDHL